MCKKYFLTKLNLANEIEGLHAILQIYSNISDLYSFSFLVQIKNSHHILKDSSSEKKKQGVK